MKRTTKRLVTALFTLLFAAMLPAQAFAAVTVDVSLGNVTVGDVNVAHSGGTEAHGGEVVVTQTNPGTATTNTISVTTTTSNIALTLSGVNIDTSATAAAAMSVSAATGSTVTVELDGKNSLTSGGNCAGLQKSGDGALVIQNENSSSGSLTANCDGYNGAGIGGGDHGGGTNITITGGKVKATGGINAAGIGGGAGSGGSNITISGGDVTANGGDNAAGIGGGAGSSGSNITISGGDVTATGGYNGAGIGGGAGNQGSGSGSNITISGGKVSATGLGSGAGIGGGSGSSGNNITVSGDAVVTTDGGEATASSGAGANIGNGGSRTNGTPVNGTEVVPDVSQLYTTGSVNGVHGTVTPPVDPPVDPPVAASQSVKALWLADLDGTPIGCKAELKDGVLSLTADEESAVLTGVLGLLKSLGAESIRLVCGSGSAEFNVEELLEQCGEEGLFVLTVNDGVATLTVNGVSCDEVLK